MLQWADPADASLSHWLRAHPKLGGRDRGELADAVFDVRRHLRRYRQFAESGTGPASRCLAILGLASVLSGPALRAGLSEPELHWLDHIEKIDPRGLSRAVRASLPDWPANRLSMLPAAAALVDALNHSAPLQIRVNPTKAQRATTRAQLIGCPVRRF